VTSQCILVVEDEPLIAADIQDVLEGFGYDVPPTASTMAAALQSVAHFRPDLVLMDVRLKGGDDGVVTAAAIRERSSVPVVFLTSHADEATLSRAQVVEPFGYLLKPFNDFELRATVQMVLQRSRREETITRQSKILTVAVNGSPEAIVAVDVDGKVLFSNEAARRSEVDVDGPHGSPWTTGSSGLRLADRETPFPPAELPLVRALRGETVSDVEIFIQPRMAGPAASLYSMNAAPLRDEDGQIIGAVAIARDILGPRLILSELHQRAETDDLTGVKNRRGFMEAAGASLQLAAHTGRIPALFFIDLNGLKQINDGLGHAEGDRAISDAAALLRSAFRASDIVARLGGDEFVVLATDASGHSAFLRERLDQSLKQFNEEAGRQYRLSMSVGIAEGDPAGEHTLASLLRKADERMYEAKELRRAKALLAPYHDPPCRD